MFDSIKGIDHRSDAVALCEGGDGELALGRLTVSVFGGNVQRGSL